MTQRTSGKRRPGGYQGRVGSRPAALLLILQLTLLGACGGAQQPPEPPPTAAVPPPRSFAMGWAPTPSQPTPDSVIATAQAMAPVSEFAILQQPVPWARLFAGESLSNLLDEQLQLVDFLRSLGLEIVWLVDPLDGLDRTREPPELVAAGRSLLEAQIRSLHEQWVLEIARRVQPAYLGLASEINSLGARGSPQLYAEIVDLVNTLTPQIHLINPQIQVFVSFQVDEAWQLPPLPPSPVDHFSLIADFNIDALGLSSYPVFFFDTPADIPDDYFARFAEATPLPLILVEGGWSSRGGLPFRPASTTPQEQANFFDRFEQLLDGVQAELWVMLFFSDIDVAAFGFPPEREAVVSNFAFMGIVDLNLIPKPAFDVWERIFSRPHQPPPP
ncbi:MAG: hypothetical protein ACE5G6_02410 [Terriglobia bacterium]